MPFLPEPLVDFCGEDSEAKFEAKNKKRQACDWEERMSDVKKCEDCGHSMREHLCDLNGRINCQVCERKGQTCDWKDIPQKRFTVLPPDPHRFYGDKDGIGCKS